MPALIKIHPTPRIVVSNHFEKQIETIQERLHVIERGFQAILGNSQRQDDVPSTTTVTNHESPGSFTTFEGDSSFIKETSEASRSATNIMGGNTPPLCAVTSSWTDYGQLERLCQKIYFPLEEVPMGAMALMHGMLCSVVREFSQHDDPAFAGYNLEDCADQSQIMCQTLGYHRESAYHNDTLETSQAKRHAFYSLYIIDKNLSLVLGRTSNFNDNDIDAQPFAFSTNPKQWPWDFYTHIIIRFAKIQGDVYDKLYSASAANLSQHERSCFIEELSMRIISLREELRPLETSGAYYSDILQMAMESADFVSYAVLTVVYRAERGFANSVEISSRCYDAAKRSLESHLKCCTSLEPRSIYQQIDYVKNTLLYPSFTPYLIVFTQAIAKTDNVDFVLLQDTVNSLARLQDLSPGSRRLYHVCRSFLNTAEVIMRSRKSVDGLEQHEDGSLVFTKKPVATVSGGQVINERLPTTWGDFARFGATTTLSSTAAGSQGVSNLDTLQFWSGWLGSTQSVTDALHLNFTDTELGGPSNAGLWN
ncbi:hypothetical protein FOXYS1_1882 [Fusarium oxysporum]|uniref:Xylanolytic transcriptional activator regulatory domain-containing protein n=1 Tax=Fusarium oxysporum TaxID=5507 RepID=A0A8H5AMB7_FUSOX|nr:hypothetical protein FOXYS1_1882 [Fusarium oxysporum]